MEFKDNLPHSGKEQILLSKVYVRQIKEKGVPDNPSLVVALGTYEELKSQGHGADKKKWDGINGALKRVFGLEGAVDIVNAWENTEDLRKRSEGK